MENLFLCCTALQLKITTRIIKERGIYSNSSVLFLGNRSEERYFPLLDFLERNISEVFFYDTEKEIIDGKDKAISRKVTNLIKRYGLEYIDFIYIANLDMSFIHHFLSQVSFNQLITFDDGTANIAPSVLDYYLSKKASFWKRNLRLNYGRKFWVEDIFKISSLHYTVYKNYVNIVPNAQYIPLYEDIHYKDYEDRGGVKIFLGAHFPSLIDKKYDINSVIENFIKEQGIDIFIPHPRDSNIEFNGCETISPAELTENFVISYLEGGFKVKLYGFASSVQLNLSNLENLENYFLDDSRITPVIRDAIHFFANKEGILISL